jgi:hypothetical protein
MLSLISPANVTPVRAQSRTGAAFQGGSPAETRLRVIEMAAVRTSAADEVFARPRPQASTGATLFGNATHAAGQAESARQQRTSKKYAHTTTRIAAAGGGALGPHPARDPV